QIDEHDERRNRVLDYLLALYGEKPDLASMGHFMGNGVAFEKENIESKIAYLNDVADIGKNRAAGFDYGRDANDSRDGTGLKRKLQTVLGLRTSDKELRQCGEKIQIVEHVLLRPHDSPKHAAITVPEDFYDFRISVVFFADSKRFINAEVRKWAEEMVYLHCPAHIDPTILWLESADLGRFEALHEAWLKAMRSSGAAAKTAAAAPLLDFLFTMGKAK
ncbi:MAG TPA: hypothetical protein VF798_10085, partial [Burkholderiaceae bacterium]